MLSTENAIHKLINEFGLKDVPLSLKDSKRNEERTIWGNIYASEYVLHIVTSAEGLDYGKYRRGQMSLTGEFFCNLSLSTSLKLLLLGFRRITL